VVRPTTCIRRWTAVLTGEIAALAYQIVAINGWNRLAVGFRSPVGDYVSPFHAAAA